MGLLNTEILVTSLYDCSVYVTSRLTFCFLYYNVNWLLYLFQHLAGAEPGLSGRQEVSMATG